MNIEPSLFKPNFQPAEQSTVSGAPGPTGTLLPSARLKALP